MKRKLTLALAVIMAAGALTGCGCSTPSENSTNSVADESAPAGTTAPVESQIESQTEPAADTSVTEPAQETVSEPEIQPLPEEIEFSSSLRYTTAAYDSIDPDALLHETIVEGSEDFEIPAFSYKWTQESRDADSYKTNFYYFPDSASDISAFNIDTLVMKPDHTANIAQIKYGYQKNEDLYYNATISFKDVSTDEKCRFITLVNKGTTPELVSDKYFITNQSLADIPITELPLLVSANVNVNSGEYVNLGEDLNKNHAVRYDITTTSYPDITKAYFYDVGAQTYGRNGTIVYPADYTNCYGIVVILYTDGTLTISRMDYGSHTEDNMTPYVPHAESVDNIVTLDDLRSSDPEFDTAYTAWLDGKMPFMIPLDEYLEKYAADSANG